MAVTIRDILKLDNDVDQIEVKIYNSGTGYIFEQYEIGSAEKNKRYAQFLYHTELCDVYRDGGAGGYRRVLINKPINQAVVGGGGWRGLTAYGTLFENIPDAILNLEIYNFGPEKSVCHHFNCHGYDFMCYVEEWEDIPGEGEEFAIEEEEEEEE